MSSSTHGKGKDSKLQTRRSTATSSSSSSTSSRPLIRNSSSVKRSRSLPQEDDADSMDPSPFPGREAKSGKVKLSIDPLGLPREFIIPDKEIHEGAIQDMKEQERIYAPRPEYFSRQPFLNPRMRAVLLDWMGEVSQEFGLKRDSLHTAVHFVDRYLDLKNEVERNALQLIGVTALFLASKLEEVMPPPVIDFSTATDLSCTCGEIIAMESRMVNVLDFHLMPSTLYSFANTFLQALSPTAAEERIWMHPSKVKSSMLMEVMDLLDLAVLDVDHLCFLPSELAGTAILCVVMRDRNSTLTVQQVEEVIGYSVHSLRLCVQWFQFALGLPPMGFLSYRSHVLEANPSQELHTIHRRNDRALEVYKSQPRDQRSHFAYLYYEQSQQVRVQDPH